MDSFLSPFAERAYALFRIVVGAQFALHGVQKVLGMLGGFGGTPGATAPFPSQMWIGGVIELVGGAAVALGLFTRPAAFLSSGTMAVAYFQFHQPGGILPLQNKGELAVIYCFAFLVIATKGTGVWGLGGNRTK